MRSFPKSKSSRVALGALVLLCGRALGEQEGKALEARGAIEAVTVYRGQALVTRMVEVGGAAGLREIIVTDLPQQVLPGSIHAEGSGVSSGGGGGAGGDVQVRSVRYRTRPVSQDVREEVRKLDAAIADLEERVKSVKRRQGLLTEHAALLEALKNFVAPTAGAELTRGVLNAETLEKLTNYIRTQRADLAETELKLAKDEAGLGQELDLRRREREKVTGGSSKVVQEAVVLISKSKEGAGRLKLRYLVDGANWSPSYNVRREAGQEGVTLEYYASIQQLSGEDWGDVKMTLSTATPSLVCKAPDLTAMTISLASLAQAEQGQAGGSAANMSKALADALRSEAKDEAVYANARQEIFKQQRELQEKRAQSDNKSTAFGRDGPRGQERAEDDRVDQSLNALACDLQMLDLLSNERIARQAVKRVGSESEGLSVTYQIAGATSLPSRNDRQQVQIMAAPLKAEMWKVAVPVLTSYVYDEGRVQNTSGMVLLAGPVTAYSAGSFVGNGDLGTIAAGESFTVGFGIDSALRASRELVEKTDNVQGGNRVVDLTYRLRIENFGDKPALVKVTDRLPKLSGGSKESEIRLTLTSASPSPAVNGEEGSGKKDGLLTWVEQVPGRAIAEKGLGLEYKFRLEYDKQMSITGLAAK